jgi:hypothetical protein
MGSALIAIGMKMLAQFLGYKFVCETSVIIMEAWGKSTKTTFDDKVFNAMAKALGIDSAVLKKLAEDADKV